MQLLKYWRSANLGDAIQTLALERLLPRAPRRYVFRDTCDADPADLFIVNGWLGKNRVPLGNTNVLFAGIHWGEHGANLEWMARSRFTVGARDPWTQAQLARAGIASDMIGCATLTLPRYRGPRTGVLSVDAGHPDAEPLTHARDGAWPWQIAEAARLLASYRTAALVVTSRLHVALPCLAFGTPVIIRQPPGEDAAHRFSLLDALEVDREQVVTLKAAAWAARYRAFVTRRQLRCRTVTPTKRI